VSVESPALRALAGLYRISVYPNVSESVMTGLGRESLPQVQPIRRKRSVFEDVPPDVQSEVESAQKYVERADVSILITFPSVDEREVLLSVVQMTAAYRLLHCFEVRIREVISMLMESKFGPNWFRTRVHHEIVALWEDKKATAVRKGFLPSRLIDYADFGEYLGIIVQKNNWREIFEPIFGNKKDTEVSFERLHPLRIETMHNRPLSRTDAAVLATEVHRLSSKLKRCASN
jgi:hypothetical protein